jgi:hypothetical protein
LISAEGAPRSATAEEANMAWIRLIEDDAPEGEEMLDDLE